MSAERDAGLAALQQGNTSAAIEQLERARQNDPTDFQAITFLGAAYGQAERHNDAVGVLTDAIHLQPSSPQARYNLAIALKNGGWPEQALAAAQQALQLQPTYDKAIDLVQKLQPNTTQQIQPPAIPNYASPDPTLYQQPPAGPNYAAPGPNYQAQPPAYGQPQYPQPQPQTLSGEAPGVGLAGGQSYGSLGSQGAAAYGGPPRSAPVFNNLPVNTYEDSFNIIQAFKDWMRIIIKPGEFFREQSMSDGKKAPLAMLFVYGFVAALVMATKQLVGGNGLMDAIVMIVIYTVFVPAFAAIGNLISAGFTNLVAGWFGGSGTYSQSFRVVVYAVAPFQLLAVLIGIIGPTKSPAEMFSMRPSAPAQITLSQAQYRQFGGPAPGGIHRPASPFGQGNFGGHGSGFPGNNSFGQPGYTGQQGVNPYAAANPYDATNPIIAIMILLLFGIGFFWTIGLYVYGVSQVHQVSTGTAFGIGVVTFILEGVVFVALMFVLSLVFVGLFAAAFRGH